MTSWDERGTAWEEDARSGDFEPAWDPFYFQSLYPWELGFESPAEIRHHRKPPLTKTAKEWHDSEGVWVRRCESCGVEAAPDEGSCAVCGKPTRKGIA